MFGVLIGLALSRYSFSSFRAAIVLSARPDSVWYSTFTKQTILITKGVIFTRIAGGFETQSGFAFHFNSRPFERPRPLRYS